MRIGIDGRELQGKPTGVGRYLSELLRRWRSSTMAAAHRFLVYTPRALDEADFMTAEGPGGGRLTSRVVPGKGATLWEQVRLPAVAAADRLDVFFAPGYTGPLLLRVPLVVGIYDVSFVAHPEWFRWREGLRRRWLTTWSARRAAAILTCSEFSRAEISSRLRVPPDRVTVTLPGFTARLAPPGRRDDTATVLYVGSIFNRRHVPDLIRAFEIVATRRSDARLVIVGENRTHPRQDLAATAAEAGVANRVTLAEYVDDGRLAELYGSARVFVLLSEYEGFGLTPLEALAAGVPVVLGDSPVAREVFGDAALFVPPGDVSATAEAILQLLEDSQARRDLLAPAARVLARYSWERAANETLRVLEAAAEARRP